MNGPRIVILVADDEDLVRIMVAVVVRRYGYQVLIASDGAEALDISRRYHGNIDLLISDVQMPRLNGIELAALIVKERTGIKVLLISSSPEVEIPAAYRFLSKPFTPAMMREILADILVVKSKRSR